MKCQKLWLKIQNAFTALRTFTALRAFTALFNRIEYPAHNDSLSKLKCYLKYIPYALLSCLDICTNLYFMHKKSYHKNVWSSWKTLFEVRKDENLKKMCSTFDASHARTNSIYIEFPEYFKCVAALIRRKPI